MKILLIMPDSHMHVLRVGSFVRSMREAPLTLTTLAALAPTDLDIDITLVDETVSKVPAGDQFDLIGISIMTGTANRGYAWADHFRKRGATVVIGGVHATIMPDEATSHADAVVAGVAERTWPELLRDFAAGKMRKLYSDHDQAACIDLTPPPRSDLLRRWRYNVANTVMATRGCRHACEFCSVPTIWKGYHKRPIGRVVESIKALPGSLLAFNDVSLFDDRQYARELMDAITPLKRKWGGLATADVADVADDDDLVDRMARSGCRFLLIGFESLSGEALRGIGKGFNRQQ
ncbi:MAG: cobalamin-dependent protein, partial [Phycisphaerae bacterium]|nr:cobalamin-dependent protein [Phycisphaerae bacterium]